MSHDKTYNTQVQRLIRQRYSCRSYAPNHLSPDDLSALREAAARCPKGPFDNQIRFKIISGSQENKTELKKLGTYGFIKNPAGFIIIAAQDLPGAMVDVGYLTEILILKATDLGIGSCWLGGTFTKSRFSKKIGLKQNETIPVVISIGYPLNRQGLMDRISRIYANADRRLPWEDLFFLNTFDHSLSHSQAGQFQEPLELIRLAPSASNKQPWRIVHREDHFHFYLQRTKNYPPPVFNQILKLADLQRIDIGIAMSHFELSVSAMGLNGKWILADPGLPQPDSGIEYIITWQPIT